MSNKKRKRDNNDEKEISKKNVKITNYEYFNNINNDYLNLCKQIDLLSSRLTNIELSLSPSSIIKAMPIMSIISGNIDCINKINEICRKWVNYTSFVANNENINYNVDELFWNLDTFIFDKYFLNLQNNNYIFEFVNVDFKSNVYNKNQLHIIQKALFKDRDHNLDFITPSNKEFISSLIKDKNIYLIYFQKELYNIINKDNKNKKNISDLQFSTGTIHPTFSFNNNIIEESDSNSVNVKMDKNVLNISENLKDKRYHILTNKRPLYNNLVNIEPLNQFNSNLYRFSPMLLNLSLIIFHAMLHIKRDINNENNYIYREHDKLFIKEYLNYTPSVLFGHSMIPFSVLPQ